MAGEKHRAQDSANEANTEQVWWEAVKVKKVGEEHRREMGCKYPTEDPENNKTHT